MEHLKKNWVTYAVGAGALVGGVVIGGLTVVGTKAKDFILGPGAKRLGEK